MQTSNRPINHLMTFAAASDDNLVVPQPKVFGTSSETECDLRVWCPANLSRFVGGGGKDFRHGRAAGVCAGVDERPKF
jgi:hypothetical protein